MLGNSKHLSGAPVFDPCFWNLRSFISKCSFILFNRVGQRDLHCLFWRAQGTLAGVHEQGLEQDVCPLACTVRRPPLLFSLCHRVRGWGWEPRFLPWVAKRLLFSCTSLGFKTVMVWLCFPWISLAAFSDAGINLVSKLVSFRVSCASAGGVVSLLLCLHQLNQAVPEMYR